MGDAGVHGPLRRTTIALAPGQGSLWGSLLAAMAIGGTVVLVAAALVVDALTWIEAGLPLSRTAAQAALASLLLVVAAGLLSRASATAARLPTRAWYTVLGISMPVVAGPVPGLAIVTLALAFGHLVDSRRRSTTAATIADLSGAVAASAMLVALGASSATPVSAGSGTEADLRQVLGATLAFALGSLVALAAIEHAGRPAPVRPVLTRRAVESGLTFLGLLVAGPVVAVLLTRSVWLAVGMMLLVAGIEVLTPGGRPMARPSTGADALTGLLGWRSMQAKIGHAVDAAASGGPPVALLVLDLDRFEEINDGHGHRTGDRVLRVVANRLLAETRPCDAVARLGGDEFGVLVAGVRDVEPLVDLARRLRTSLAARIDDRGTVFGPGASVGIAVAPEHATTASQLMARASAAVHAAKSMTTGVRVYDRDSDAVARRLGMVATVRSALDDGALQLAYQPKVALGTEPGTDVIAGVEALLRFAPEAGRQIEPGRVVPVVEGTGLMGRLTAAVLDGALGQVASWLAEGERIPVAVNVSLRDLEDPDFADSTYTALARAGVPGSLLTLEITERVLTGDLSAVVRSMSHLQRIGVRMSLDDFGTGWSSLLLLRRLPVAEVKLDRAFVDGIDGTESGEADGAVVEAVVQLAHRLRLTMVAEGVERYETLARLRRAGCDVAQGYLLSPPLAPEDVIPWSRHHAPARLRVVS